MTAQLEFELAYYNSVVQRFNHLHHDIYNQDNHWQGGIYGKGDKYHAYGTSILSVILALTLD